jgi:adenylate kinase
MFYLILFGPPGSGKGTQSVKIAERFNFAHISTGDIFRNEIKNKTPLGLKVQRIIEKGELVSDELLIEILSQAMEKYENVDGFVLDGFPRTLKQAEDFDHLLSAKGQDVSLVLALDVNEEEIVKRLLKRAELEGRKDDTEEVIRKRMNVYYTQTKPLIEYYKKRGKYESVYGIGSIDDISEKLFKSIEKHL